MAEGRSCLSTVIKLPALEEKIISHLCGEGASREKSIEKLRKVAEGRFLHRWGEKAVKEQYLPSD